jgi:prolyl 4-hydroxylase
MEHHDESGDVHKNLFDPSGPRIMTFFLYLNDVEEGGETRFTDLMGDDSKIYLDVAPKKGRALLWPSMLNEDLLAYDIRTYHAATEVKKGLKYGANAWLHLRDVRNYECNEVDVEEMRDKWGYMF